jgi:hypothetical protein
MGRQIVLRGAFYCKNTERSSFELMQGGDEVEVFWEQLSSTKQSLVLNQKNFSAVPVVVVGTVQRFRDARNSYYIMASDVVFTGAALAPATPRQAGLVLYTDILLVPDRYLEKFVTMRGAFNYRNTERESFDLKQGDDTVEVFYEQLPEQKRALILQERNFSGDSATVVGTVHRFRETENSYYIMAADVSILRAQPAVAAPGQIGRQEGGTGAFAASPIPAQLKPSRPFPTTPIVREPSRARRTSELEGNKTIDEVARATVISVVCLVVLLTTIWVAIDSWANKIACSKGPYSLANGALVWVPACVLLWIAAFPYYLVRRSTVLRDREKVPQTPGPVPIVPLSAPTPARRDEPGQRVSPPTGQVDAGWKLGKSCYYAERNKTVGPMEEAHLHVLIKAGQLNEHKTLVWQEGMSVWWFYDEVFAKQGTAKRRPVPANAPPLPVSSAAPTEFALPAEQQSSSTEVGSVSKQPGFVKGACQQCGGHLEFNSLNTGQIINCPHCHKQTRLGQRLDAAGDHSQLKAKSLPVGIPLGHRRTTPATSAPANPAEN